MQMLHPKISGPGIKIESRGSQKDVKNLCNENSPTVLIARQTGGMLKNCCMYQDRLMISSKLVMVALVKCCGGMRCEGDVMLTKRN